MKIIQDIVCILLNHNWIKTTFIKYDIVGGWIHYKCTRCKTKKKEYYVEYL